MSLARSDPNKYTNKARETAHTAHAYALYTWAPGPIQESRKEANERLEQKPIRDLNRANLTEIWRKVLVRIQELKPQLTVQSLGRLQRRNSGIGCQIRMIWSRFNKYFCLVVCTWDWLLFLAYFLPILTPELKVLLLNWMIFYCGICLSLLHGFQALLVCIVFVLFLCFVLF